MGITGIALLFAAERTVEARGGPVPVDGFMREGRVIARGVDEGFDRRLRYLVGADGLAGLIAAGDDLRFRRGEEDFAVGDAREGCFGRRIGKGIEVRGQAFDLLDVKTV